MSTVTFWVSEASLLAGVREGYRFLRGLARCEEGGLGPGMAYLRGELEDASLGLPALGVELLELGAEVGEGLVGEHCMLHI